MLWFCYFQLANIVEFVTALNNTNSEFHVDVDCLNVRVNRELTRTGELPPELSDWISTLEVNGETSREHSTGNLEFKHMWQIYL